MKETLTTSQVADKLFADKENNGFSYAGCRALAEWLEEYEESTGQEMELDVVAIRCDFSEHETALECVESYGYDMPHFNSDDSDDDKNGMSLEFLKDNTILIEFEGGIIIQAF